MHGLSQPAGQQGGDDDRGKDLARPDNRVQRDLGGLGHDHDEHHRDIGQREPVPDACQPVQRARNKAAPRLCDGGRIDTLGGLRLAGVGLAL